MDNDSLNSQEIKEIVAVIITMIGGLIANTLVNDEPFNVRRFVGEMILAIMFGASIYAFGIIQELGFWQTLLIALLSGMGTTRSLEWLIKVTKITKGN